MNELVAKINWKNPKVYCVAVIVLGILVVIASNALTLRFGRPHPQLRSLGLIVTFFGLVGILVAGVAERTIRMERPEKKIIMAKRVVAWEERICRVLGVVFSFIAMMWFLHCLSGILSNNRFYRQALMYSGTNLLLCVGMAILSFIVGSLFTKR